MKKISQQVINSVILSLSIISGCLSAQASSNITVESGHIRETIPGTVISSAYMTINNLSSSEISLIKATSDISDRMEIHEHTMENGMMNMQQRPSIKIAGNSRVILQPSGLHLMIFDLKKPLKDGEIIPITLKFTTHADVLIKLPVESIKRKKHVEKKAAQTHSHH
jgi:copper(I)-binding protein